MDFKYYKLADGRIWDIEKAQWLADEPVTIAEGVQEIAQGPDDENSRLLISAEGVSDVAYLARTLEFYNLPLGVLEYENAAGIKRALAALDAEYLTPRTLAGMATGDTFAIRQWNRHEEKAAPLRQRLAQLEGKSLESETEAE